MFRGSLAQVKASIKAGQDVNASGTVGGHQLPSLALAASFDYRDMCAVLLAAGADVNTVDEGGCTAVHVAAQTGHREVCRALLLAGANLDAMDVNACTPLYGAAGNGHSEVCNDLLAAGANVNSVGGGRNTPPTALQKVATLMFAGSW